MKNLGGKLTSSTVCVGPSQCGSNAQATREGPLSVAWCGMLSGVAAYRRQVQVREVKCLGLVSWKTVSLQPFE